MMLRIFIAVRPTFGLAWPRYDASVIERTRLALIYLSAFFASLASTMLTLGFFYFTARVWGWDARLNLALAAGQNAAYVVGSLLAHAVSEKFSRQRALIGLYAIMTIICAITAGATSHAIISCCLIVYMFFTAMTWPMIESLCAESRDAHEMSRRVGTYNLTWAVAGAIAVIVTGVLIERWRVGMFLVPAMLHASTVVVMLVVCFNSDRISTLQAAVHLEPETDLLRSRTLALWLSRIALPAMYVVNYALGAILPTLAVMGALSPMKQALCGSVWVVARMIGFALLGATLFWHTRPRLLLLASVLLLLSFCGSTLASSLPWMLAAQIVVGGAMAMIYTASLYFGMVLSDGSTEHGGYHEALIGLGGVIGPGAGALVQMLRPGDPRAAVATVGGIVAVSVIAAAGASIRLRAERSRA